MLTYYIPNSKECPIAAIKGIHFDSGDNIADVVKALIPFMSANDFKELRKIFYDEV